MSCDVVFVGVYFRPSTGEGDTGSPGTRPEAPFGGRPDQVAATAPGTRLNIKTAFSRYGDSHVKDKTLIFNMGIPILVRRHLYIESAHRKPGPGFNIKTSYT